MSLATKNQLQGPIVKWPFVTNVNWCNNYMGNYPNCIFVELQLAFIKNTKKFKMMNKFTYC